MRSGSALFLLAFVVCLAATAGCRGRLLRDPDPVYCYPVQCQPAATGAAQPCAPCQPVVCCP